jgi:glycosyltransferase involved in cell wall biosynthesis
VRILMIAPEPFFEPRGTPFSEFHRIRALTALGHHVDLVTYPFGQSVSMPGLRVFRSLRPPFVDHVKIGPSLAKIPLDALLALSALRRALSGRYDVVHSHEEGGLIGAILAMLLRVPHLYDMHSSLPQQLSNFAFSRSRIIKSVFLAIERFMIRRSRVVIVICPSLEETVKAIEPGAQTVLIENAPGSSEDEATPAAAAAVRRSLQLDPSTPVVLYTGTFEAYQGLDLLFAAMAIVRRTRPDARLVLAGGRADQVTKAREQALAAGIEDVTMFAGERPASEIPAYLLAADLLVSPRSRGTNTPLKLYQYLRSGKAIVATRLLTHTQVLSDDTAILTGATPQEYAEGILAGLTDTARAATLGRQARTLAETKYSYDAYLDKTRQACAALLPTPPAGAVVKDVA